MKQNLKKVFNIATKISEQFPSGSVFDVNIGINLYECTIKISSKAYIGSVIDKVSKILKQLINSKEISFANITSSRPPKDYINLSKLPVLDSFITDIQITINMNQLEEENNRKDIKNIKK